jgi:hypothetical protein
MKNAVFWDVKPCDSCKNRRIGGIIGAETISELGTTLAVNSNSDTLRVTSPKTAFFIITALKTSNLT